MLKNCFGCCSLRYGVSCSAIFNIFWNILELIKHGVHRNFDYDKKIKRPLNSTTIGFNTTEFEDNIMTEEYEMFPAMHGIFMDYLFIVCYGWIVLELIVNIGLKRATFKHTTQNIYAWLIVYYGNLIFMIIHMVYYVVNRIIMFGSFENFLHAHFFYHEHGIHFFSNSIYIIIIAVEIFVTHSYYIAEEKAKLQKFVRIKWNYVSRGEVVSNGVNYPSATNFNDLTSRGTQERSKIPPYITNVLQD